MKYTANRLTLRVVTRWCEVAPQFPLPNRKTGFVPDLMLKLTTALEVRPNCAENIFV